MGEDVSDLGGGGVTGGIGRSWELTHEAIRAAQIGLRKMLMDGNYEVLAAFENTVIRNSAESSPFSYIFTRYIDAGEPVIIASTPVFRREFSYSDEELDGKNLGDVFKLPDDVGNLKGLIALIKEPSPRRVSLPVYDGKGKEVLTYISIGKGSSIKVPTHFFRQRREKVYNYTQIEICAIGTFERDREDKFKRRRYDSVKRPETVYQLRVKQIVRALEKVRGGSRRTVLWNLDRNLKTEFGA